ncbi:MAG: hypothetical protein J6T74_01405 [Clostridia bacterium]|nr:hypothetical protein [Clostridia bacterium]
MGVVRRVNGYMLASEKLKENKLRILDIGGTHFRVKNTGNTLTIDNISLHFDGKGNLTVFRDATNSITLHSFDELKQVVNRYRIMYKKALVFSKQLQIEEDFCE